MYPSSRDNPSSRPEGEYERALILRQLGREPVSRRAGGAALAGEQLKHCAHILRRGHPRVSELRSAHGGTQQKDRFETIDHDLGLGSLPKLHVVAERAGRNSRLRDFLGITAPSLRLISARLTSDIGIIRMTFFRHAPSIRKIHSRMVNHSSLNWRAMMNRFASALLAAAFFAAPAAAQDMGACLSNLRGAAAKQGISTSVFDRTLAGVTADPKVLELKDSQPEFKTPVWDYIGFLVDERKIEQGQALLRQYDSVLDAVERRFGVDRHAVVAVWGVESDYGQMKARFGLPRSLATLSCYGRRQKFFRGELMAMLKIIQRGDLAPEQLAGSWAGRSGIPSSCRAPISASPLTAMAMDGAILSIPSPMRSLPRPIT